MEDLTVWMYAAFGNSMEPMSWTQTLARAMAIFFIGLVLVRSAPYRIFSQATPLDIILSVIIGSNLSRTMTGSAPFLKTVTATILLVAVYSLLSHFSSRFRPLANLVKGKPVALVRDGEVIWREMRACAVGERDLDAAIRSAGGTAVEDVELAVMERGGDIEVVLK